MVVIVEVVAVVNLYSHTDSRDSGYSWFFSDHPDKFRYSAVNYDTAMPFRILSNSLFVDYSVIRRYI
jgi:hypothetical protein